jgi:hypothetical protein
VWITFDLCNGVAPVLSEYPWCYIYPNPFKKNFTIFSEKKILTEIYDISGRLIEKQECQGSITAGENLGAGIYFIEAVYNNQRKIYKVIKAE